MLPGIRNSKLLRCALWTAVALLALPAIAHAASCICDWVGLGPTDGGIEFTEKGAVDEIAIVDSNVGIYDGNVRIHDGSVGVNLTAPPGQRLHLGDGNFVIERGGETAMKIKRDVAYTSTVSGLGQNPIFELGRIIQAGDGDPEFRFLYSDDNTPEGSVLEFDRKGIVASVKTDRGSHFEGFISGTDAEPIFRPNSYPAMRLEMGNGGSSPIDVAIQRETTSTLTFLTDDVERVRIDSAGIEVSDGYIKLDTSSGAPPSSDCVNANEVGRMKVDSSSPILYVCTALGWRKTMLVTYHQRLPSVYRQ